MAKDLCRKSMIHYMESSTCYKNLYQLCQPSKCLLPSWHSHATRLSRLCHIKLIKKFVYIVAIVEHLYIDWINYSAKHSHDSLVTVPRPMKTRLCTYAAIFCLDDPVPIFTSLVWRSDPADVAVSISHKHAWWQARGYTMVAWLGGSRRHRRSQ